MTDPAARLTIALTDRYTIERQLGAGGMATVYLAEDLKHHRQVAVKVLRPELAAILGAERFLKEIEVTANLQHPGILPLYDSGEADSFLYYVMPYVEGESLRDKLGRERQLGVEETVKIAQSVAAALDFAHERGVVHRDIKPENILLQAGQPLVADFGIALAVSQAGGTRLTETGLSLGTPQYMSPEQATGDRELDARSDIYSLGCVVYEMLVGDPPHLGGSAQAIIAKILSERPASISQSRDSVPRNVDAAVLTALAKIPADRFATAAAFAEALTNPAFTSASARADEPPGPETGGHWKRLTVATSVLAALSVLFGVWSWSQRTAPGNVMRLSILFPEDQQLAPSGWGDFAISPDGRSFVYRAASANGGVQLYLRSFDELRASPIPGTDGADQPFFSPDGQSVGYGMRGDALRVVDLAGGPPLTVTDSAARAAWGSDGNVYFMPPDGTIRRVAVGEGLPEIIDTAKGRVLVFDLLPGEKGALTVDGSTVTVLEFATGQTTSLFPGMSPRYVPTGHILYLRENGTLFGAPFDLDRLDVTGPSVALVEGVATGLEGSGKFAVSKGGMLLYKRAGRSASSLVLVRRDGVERSLAFGLPAFDVRVAPDGTRAAVAAAGQGRQDFGVIWIVDLMRGSKSRLAVGGYPEWTPDSRRVAFYVTSEDEQDLYWKPADGSAEEQLVFQRPGMQNEITFSRDGRWIVYREGDRTFGESTDLSYLDTSTGEHRPLLHTPFMERSPRLSPNGRWLAYVTNESGRDEVWVRAFPGPGGAWQISEEGGSEPLWAHDGEELFYRTALDLVAVAVRTEGTFSPGPHTVLFRSDAYQGQENHTTYDVMPDDETFVFMKPNPAGEVSVVLNFFEELKAKVGQ